MNGKIYRIAGTLVFPQGLAVGEGRDSNVISIARDGRGEPVLRGTSLAGALRAQYRSLQEGNDEDQWFGEALDGNDDTGRDSLVVVADIALNCGKSGSSVRTHNLVNRHTGAVADQGLFSLEQLPPETAGELRLYVDTRGTGGSGEGFVQSLLDILGNGLTLGGNRNRGIGSAQCKDNTVTVNEFDITTLAGYGAWMDARFADRKGTGVPGGVARILSVGGNKLVVNIELAIPRGEDIVVGYGTTLEYGAEPQNVGGADGTRYWRIPGASLRGLFRSWITRLAARDDKPVRDSAERWNNQFAKGGQVYKPHSAAGGFATDDEAKEFSIHPEKLNDPVMDLFGSVYKRGRIHISDALSTTPANEKQQVNQRMHVAVDRFSGGANEGGLFSNTVLCGPGIAFNCSMAMDPKDDCEVEWLIKTLRALHLGILRVGSSKASGRLEIAGIAAEGKGAEAFDVLAKEIAQ